MIKYFFCATILLLASCTLPEEKDIPGDIANYDTNRLQTSDSNSAAQRETEPLQIKPAKKIRQPSGIFQAVLPVNGKMEQTVAFYDDLTYQLQEEYHTSKKDSIVMTSGNWSPSDGFIWLYKDQVVRGRYHWKGDTLQYFSPVSRKSFSMNRMPDAMENTAWQKKKKEGIILFGVGNEPFWSVEYNKDSVSFLLSEWTQPLQLKSANTVNTKDSVVYTAQNDSTQLRVTVFPYFCNDGMSDFVYKNRIRVQYNSQVYNGCGILYK